MKKNFRLKQQRQRLTGNLPATTFTHQDNYDVQDMDIEPPPPPTTTASTPTQSASLQQISPLSCRTNFNNEPTTTAPHSLPAYNTFFLNCQRHTYPSNLPGFFFSPTAASSEPVSTTETPLPLAAAYMPPLHASHFSPPMPLTLEQQQNELNEMIEARYQAEQHRYRKLPPQAFQKLSNLRQINLVADTAKPLIEIDLTAEDSDERHAKPPVKPVVFTLSSESSSSSSVKSLSPVAVSGAAFSYDIDLRPGGVEVAVDPFEKEKAMKADLMRKLLIAKQSPQALPGRYLTMRQ